MDIQELDVIKDIKEPLKEVEKVEPSKADESKAEETQVKKKEKKEEVKEEKKEERNWEEDFKKLEVERDNYKTALLTAKGKSLSLGDKKDKKEKPESEWDDTSEKFQKDTIDRVDKLVSERLEKRNEQGAIRKFLEKHPILASNGLAWDSVVTTYKPTRGKDTMDDVLEDLEDAYLVARRKDGTLKEDFKKAEQEGERKGAVKAKTAQMASVSGAGNHSVSKTSSKSGLSSSAKKMADKMRTPLDKLEKEDDSISAVIKF